MVPSGPPFQCWLGQPAGLPVAMHWETQVPYRTRFSVHW